MLHKSLKKDTKHPLLRGFDSAVKCHSFRPIWNMLCTYFNLPSILRNRRTSINQECAFLINTSNNMVLKQ